MFRQTRTALRAPTEYSGSKSTRFNAVGAEIFCRVILLLGDLQRRFAGFHQSGLGLKHHVIDDTLEVSSLLEYAQLAVCAGTVLQHAVNVSDFFPAIEFVDHIIHKLEIFEDEIAFADLTLLAEVDELAADTVTRSAPLIFHNESAAVLTKTLIARVQLVQLHYSRLDQCGECDRFVQAQRNVADADLEGVEEWVRADIPPDLFGVIDALGTDQQVDEVLEVAPTGEGVRNIGARKLVKDFAAIRFQPGVHSKPEWRIRRERQQVRQEVAHRVHQMDSGLAVFHPNVHVQSEDEVGACDQLHVFDDLVIALVGINLLCPPVSKWMRGAGSEQQPILVRQLHHLGAELTDLRL